MEGNEGKPSSEEKAKAVYFGLIGVGHIIIQDIIKDVNDDQRNREGFESFLSNEIGVILCLISTIILGHKEAEEDKLFVANLFNLFINHLKIRRETLKQYVMIFETWKDDFKKAQINSINFFSSRISAFLDGKEELLSEETLQKYSDDPGGLCIKTLVDVGAFNWMKYWPEYERLNQMACEIMRDYTDDSNNEKILKASKKFDEYL